MELLTRLEETILIVIHMLNDEAYGVPINREVSRIIHKPYSMGGLYFALDQLVRKEYLMKRTADPTPKRGGRSRAYYRLTPEGRQALKAVRRHQLRLWNIAPEFSPEIGVG